MYGAYDRLIRTIRTDGSYNLIGESSWTLDNNASREIFGI